MKKILHVTVSSKYGGGAEHLFRLVECLQDSVACYIATPLSEPYHKKFETLVGADKLVILPERRFKLFKLIQLCCFIKKNKIDIIHSHGKGAGIYARLAALFTSLKCVHTFHGIHLQYSPLFLKIYLLIERMLRRCTDSFICVSKGERDVALRLGFATKNNTNLIENGVAIPETLSPTSSGPFTIVHVSRFDPDQKNSEALIPIVKELKERYGLTNMKVNVLGSGEMLPKCIDAAHENKLDAFFNFVGFQEHPRHWLRGEEPVLGAGRAHCYLSTSRWEGLPLAILEAMSEGVPVIASNVTGNRDAVKDGHTGFLYELDDPAAAAECCHVLFKNKKLRETLSHNAYNEAKAHYSVMQMGKATYEVYQKLIPPSNQQ